MLDSKVLPHLHACLPFHILIWHAAADAAPRQLTGTRVSSALKLRRQLLECLPADSMSHCGMLPLATFPGLLLGLWRGDLRASLGRGA